MMKFSLTHLGLFVGRDRCIPPTFRWKAGYSDPALQRNAYVIWKSFLFLLLVLSSLSLSARATELTDLGEGLSYLRIHAIDESAKGLTAAVREREFLILDLRHANTTTDSAELLRAALAARTFKRPVFILIGPATPTAIGDSFAPALGKSITFGVKETFPTPQIIIDQPVATDRLAYEALESGQPLASLISGKISKERFDEAVLMKEFNNGNINAGPFAYPVVSKAEPSPVERPPSSDPVAKPANAEKLPASTVKADEKAAAKPVEPLIDRVLQRAVHLHRALAAIKPR